MGVRAIFAISVLMSLVSSTIVAKLYVWPWPRALDQGRGLAALVAPHMFLRFIGLSFLVPGVVVPALPTAFTARSATESFPGARNRINDI